MNPYANITNAVNPVRMGLNAYDWLDKNYGPTSHELESMRLSKEVGLPYEPGLVDLSGISALPVANAFRGLKGIQLAKGKDLARKASWAKERGRRKADAKIFASGVALAGSDLVDASNPASLKRNPYAEAMLATDLSNDISMVGKRGPKIATQEDIQKVLDN